MFGEAFDGRDVLVGAYTKVELPSEADLASENACVTDGVAITGDQLDSVFYFPQHFQAMRDVIRDGQSTKRLEDLWAARLVNYGTTPPEGGIGVAPTHALVNFIDNHDVPRFLFEGSPEALRVALAFTFFAPGIPCVYYGTEQGFAGGNDPANREDMWLSGYDESHPLFLYTQRLARIRKASAAIRRGDWAVTWASERGGDEPDAGIFAFERKEGDAGGSYALFVANTNAKKESVTEAGGKAMETSLAAGTTLVDVLDPAQPTFTVAADKTLKVSVPAQRTRILIPQEQLVR
jgi:alpha-amylase